MTLNSLFKRFIKDNGLYTIYKNRVKYYFNSSRRNVACSRNHSNVGDLIIDTFGTCKEFYGGPERKRLYRLSSKWRKIIKNAYIQHNINVGDTVKIYSAYDKETREYVVKEFDDKTRCVIASTRGLFGYIDQYIPIFRIKSKVGEELINNLYYVENGISYGKIENAECNEIQLQ